MVLKMSERKAKLSSMGITNFQGYDAVETQLNQIEARTGVT
jgi:hypothetical protein